MHPQTDQTIIADLPPGIVVHDLSFDWAGKRIAVACSDTTVKIYLKKADSWIPESSIKIQQGYAAWKAKWARPEFGLILATCSLDRNVRIYEMRRVDKNEKHQNQWVMVYNISDKTVQDIKFTPSKCIGLCLAVVSMEGYVKMYSAEDPQKLKNWSSTQNLLVNELGLNCLSWSKNLIREDECIIAIGCKAVDTSPRRVMSGMKTNSSQEPYKLDSTNTVAFVSFNRTSRQFQKITNHKIKEDKAINDISFALLNGRSYHLLAIASDTFIKIYQVAIREQNKEAPQLDVSESSFYRVSWNIMGTYLSASQPKKVNIWRAITRGVWTEIKELEE